MRNFALTALAIIGSLALNSVSSAATSDSVSFSIASKVVAQQIDAKPGEKSFLVTSNTPFAVKVGGVIGEVAIELASSGDHNGLYFGSASSLMGPTNVSIFKAMPSLSDAHIVSEKTAQRRGSLVEQAVKITIRYDEIGDADVQFVAAK